MKLYALLTLWVAAAHGNALGGGACPEVAPFQAFRRGGNQDSEGDALYLLDSEVEEEYQPGNTYTLELLREAGSSHVTDLHLVASALDEDLCPEPGQFSTSSCPHSLRLSNLNAHDSVVIGWTAPRCGCVTLRASAVTADGVLYADDSDLPHGPLTLTLCPKETPTVTSLLDDDFFGIEEQDTQDEPLIEEVANVISEDDELLDEDEDDIIEDEDVPAEDEEIPDEEGPRRRGDRRHRERGHHGRRWHRRQMRKQGGEEDEEERQERQPARGRFHHGRRGMGHMKRRWQKRWQKRQSSEKVLARRGGRLDRLCQRLEGVVGAPRLGQRLSESGRTSKTERVQTVRAEFRQCCGSEGEDRLTCFREVHGRRLEAKLCGADESHFEGRDLPDMVQKVKGKCCELQGSEQTECLLKTVKIMKKMRRFRRNKASPAEGVSRICRHVRRSPVPHARRLETLPLVQRRRWTAIFTARRLAMADCCELEAAEHEGCLVDVRQQRFDRVCQGEEPLGAPWRDDNPRGDAVVEECCALYDDDRHECFNQKMPMRRHREKTTEDTDASKESKVPARGRNAPAWKRKANKAKRQLKRQCCKGGRKAGDEMAANAQRWLTCKNEAAGYVVDKPKATSASCSRSFRRCCLSSAIRNAREEAVDEEEMKPLDGEMEVESA